MNWNLPLNDSQMSANFGEPVTFYISRAGDWLYDQFRDEAYWTLQKLVDHWTEHWRERHAVTFRSVLNELVSIPEGRYAVLPLGGVAYQQQLEDYRALCERLN